MKRPIELVLFDLGGTLIYENGAWDGLFEQADQELWRVLHQAGVQIGPRDVYGDSGTLFDVYYRLHRNDLAEPTTGAVLSDLLTAHGVHVAPEIQREALRAMFTVTQANWLPEQDALPTLAALRNAGYRLGIISNASDEDNTQALIDKAGLRPYLQFITCSALYGMRKPDPGIFRSALDYFGVAPDRAVMVGDNYEADILGGRGVGMQTIWITRRAPEPAPDAKHAASDAVVRSLSEIPPIIGVS